MKVMGKVSASVRVHYSGKEAWRINRRQLPLPRCGSYHGKADALEAGWRCRLAGRDRPLLMPTSRLILCLKLTVERAEKLEPWAAMKGSVQVQPHNDPWSCSTSFATCSHAYSRWRYISCR